MNTIEHLEVSVRDDDDLIVSSDSAKVLQALRERDSMYNVLLSIANYNPNVWDAATLANLARFEIAKVKS